MTALRLIHRVDVLQQLLAAVAAVPAGVKLSIPQLRDALVSQADVLAGLETLCLAGELDRATLRPRPGDIVKLELSEAIDAVPIPPPMVGQTGAALADALVHYSERHGLALKRVSQHLFGSPAALSRLRSRRTVRFPTLAKVSAFIGAPPPPGLDLRHRGGPRAGANVTGGSLRGKAHGDTIDPGVLLGEIRAFLKRSGMNVTCFGREAVNDPALVTRLNKAGGVRLSTVERVRAFITAWRAPPPKPPLSFEEQLGRVERGEVGIGPNIHIGRPDPSGTLGGVTGDMSL